MAEVKKHSYTVPHQVWDMYPDVARMVTTLGLDAWRGTDGMVVSGSRELVNAFTLAYPGIVNHHAQYGQPSVDALDQNARERLKDVRANTPRATAENDRRIADGGFPGSRRRIVLPDPGSEDH